MSRESKIIEEKILSEYFKIISEGFVPQTKALREKVKYRMDVECFDLIYGQTFEDEITENAIHDVLSLYKHVHYHDGKRFFECQNPLFFEWFSYQKILLLTQNP
ncbi:MAG: hypothetical protein K0R00_215 [Herbinix sp.]|jgi:hypothetical protein|nr:hypothetical protein [Herbinix sp.]